MSDTPMASLAIPGDGFRVGRVLNRSLAIYLHNFPRYFAIAAAMGLPTLFSALYATELGRMVAGASHGTNILYSVGLMLPWVLVFVVAQSAMIHGAFQDIRGRPFEIRASILSGLRRFFPVIGTGICAFVVVMIGMVLLIVPGFMALTMLFVVIPACVVEALGPLQSLRRSRELTRGQRWRIFAIYLVPAAAIAICNLLLQRVGIRVFGFGSYVVGSFLLAAIGGGYQAIANIVTYHELRAAKEGLDIEQLAAVFD